MREPQMKDAHERFRDIEREKYQRETKGQIPVMDLKTLRHICLENDGYETPELNDNLYAHFKGFRKIEGLEPYKNLKALWLESNGLYKIENVSSLSQLRCLYLSKNLLDRIENLEVCSIRTQGRNQLSRFIDANQLAYIGC